MAKKKKSIGLTREAINDIVRMPSLKPGPESDYDPSYCDAIVTVAAQGGHQAEMCLACGVKSRTTLYNWREKHPEFDEAYQFAQLVSLAYHEKVQLAGAMGMLPGFNSTTMAVIMNNKFGEDYKRGAGGNASTEINITNNTVNLTSEEMDARIAQITEKLKSSGIDVLSLGHSKPITIEHE